MSVSINIPQVLMRPSLRNERRILTRRCHINVVSQPLSGYFINAQSWESMSRDHQILARIYAVARDHPYWPVSVVSAAALFGVKLPKSFHKHIHFATDIHTSTSLRKRIPIRFHYIKDSCPKRAIERAFRHSCPAKRSDSIIAHPYHPINDRIGILNGVLVTSPLQTIFDCMRTLPFEYALIVGDHIARKFNLSRQKILRFANKRRHCWKLSPTLFKLGFIDAKSENGGESFCRGRIIRAGFVEPILQKEIENPLFALNRRSSPTLQSTRVIRPDYVWTIKRSKRSRSNLSARPFQHIAAEMDEKGKYFDRTILTKSHTDTAAVIMREKDRETALSLKNFKLIRFQFSEAYELQGHALVEKLRLAGVPTVSKWEARRRERLLARYTGDKTLLRLD